MCINVCADSRDKMWEKALQKHRYHAINASISYKILMNWEHDEENFSIAMPLFSFRIKKLFIGSVSVAQ